MTEESGMKSFKTAAKTNFDLLPSIPAVTVDDAIPEPEYRMALLRFGLIVRVVLTDNYSCGQSYTDNSASHLTSLI